MTTHRSRRPHRGQQGHRPRLRDGAAERRRRDSAGQLHSGRHLVAARRIARIRHLDGSRRDPGRVPCRHVRQNDPTAPVRQTLRAIIADGDTAVAEWTSHARSADGQTYENDYAVVFQIRGDKIAAVREYFDTAYARRVLFSDAA